MKNRGLSSYNIVLLVFGFLAVFSIEAEETVDDEFLSLYGSEEFISIATGYKQPIHKAPAVASIISAERIKRMGATDIDEVLETIPGLHVSRSPQGYNPIYTFRGIYSGFNPQVLMLIDGVPLSNLFTGNRSNAWAGFLVERIDRIEVIRGPGSAIYGADAFAGVINIITKNGQTTEGIEVGIRYGSDNTKNLFLNYGKKWDESSFAFFLQGYNSDGSDEKIIVDSQGFLDAITGTSASLAPSSLNLSRETIDLKIDYNYKKLSVSASYQKGSNGGTGAGIVQALDENGRFIGKRLNLNFNYDFDELTDWLSATIYGSYLKISQEVEEDVVLFPPGSTGPFLSPIGQPLFPPFAEGVIGNPEVFETHSRLDSIFHFTGVDDQDITVGLGYYYGDIYKITEEKNYCTDLASCSFILPRLAANRLVDVSDTPFVFLKEVDRKNYHIFIQDVFHLGNDWEMTVGVRYDDYSDFGETVNPRLALVWSTTNKLTTKFLYGEAFRAPSFSETRNINNPAALGNPDLEPETLKSFEVVFDYQPISGLEYVINAFYYQWDDIIQFIPDPTGGTSTAQNAGEQTGYGLEAEIQWQPVSTLDLLANFAYQKPTDEENNQDAANSPKKQLFIQANWEFSQDYHLSFQANWVMDRSRGFDDQRSEIDDYVIVDMSVRRKHFLNQFELSLHIKNIFDEDAREPSANGLPVAPIPNDLPLSGRRLIGEVRYNF